MNGKGGAERSAMKKSQEVVKREAELRARAWVGDVIQLIDFGWGFARLDGVGNRLTIVIPSFEEEGCHVTAVSVVVWGEIELLRLRNALNEAYPLDEGSQ